MAFQVRPHMIGLTPESDDLIERLYCQTVAALWEAVFARISKEETEKVLSAIAQNPVALPAEKWEDSLLTAKQQMTRKLRKTFSPMEMDFLVHEISQQIRSGTYHKEPK